MKVQNQLKITRISMIWLSNLLSSSRWLLKVGRWAYCFSIDGTQAQESSLTHYQWQLPFRKVGKIGLYLIHKDWQTNRNLPKNWSIKIGERKSVGVWRSLEVQEEIGRRFLCFNLGLRIFALFCMDYRVRMWIYFLHLFLFRMRMMVLFLQLPFLSGFRRL